jgi:hypothetical protein
LKRCALGISVAAALLAGCGERLPPFGTAAPAQGRQAPPLTARGRSWMQPAAMREDLLYVADQGAGEVVVYSYPQGVLVGTLTGPSDPTGDCIDEKGDVWIVDQAGEDVSEYAHGGSTPLQTLSLPGRGEILPISCAVDRTSGDLAITSWYGGTYVYQQAQGTPKTYSAHWYSSEDCTYDDKGNLYVDANAGNEFYQRTALYELRKGGQEFRRLHFRPGIPRSFGWAGGLRWDGKQIALGDQSYPGSYDTSLVYQIGRHQRVVKVTGSIKLTVDGIAKQFWIQGKTLIAPSYQPGEDGEVALYDYPSGGSPISTITGLSQPVAVTVSLAK